MTESKLRVGFITSSILVKTGFSNHIRSLLPSLYKTGKYELFHLNQGLGDTPDYQRFPWHNEGVFQNGTFDVGRFQSQDEGYKRFVSYGNLAVEKFIINNKLDVVIHIEDIWSSAPDTYFKSKWWPYYKTNFLQWTTADSLPILPDFKAWAENCPNMWFWTSFAEKALKTENIEKYNHVTTVPGCLDANEYKPILAWERNEIRRKNNIDNDTFLFLQVGRNQLRKLYPFTIESFAKFKKFNPNIKAKLVFHCSWQEGWPLERLIAEYKLNKDDVLTTYFCRNCGQWELKSFQGEYLDCRFCGTKGQPPSQPNPAGNGQKTAGIDSSISNKEMSKLYGICDGAVSAFTSGGLEFFSVESLLCGLPLLCTDYSCGKDFTCNDFVFTLDGTHTFEVGTGFQKHVPNLNTMVKFYEKICSMSPDEKRKITQKGREWAVNTFDVNVISAKLQAWLDSRSKVNWDFQYKFELKDPHAQIVNLPDNKEFIKQCYNKILKMDVKDDDSGLLYWEKFLSDTNNPNNTRDNLVNHFRGVAFHENQANAPKVDYSSQLIANNKKHLLIVLKESIGDLIMSTALLESFRSKYNKDEWNIYFGTNPQYKDIFDGNPNIDKVLDYQPFMENELECTGAGNHKGYFQAYCHLGNAMQHKLNYLTNKHIGQICI